MENFTELWKEFLSFFSYAFYPLLLTEEVFKLVHSYIGYVDQYALFQ